VIRRAVAADVPQLLVLMRKLAAFEGYLDRFAVTEGNLLERGFLSHKPEFISWVVEQDVLQAYALAYSIPFTFDLRPTVVLKELFVDEAARGSELGSELFQAVIRYACLIDARLIRWQVLPENDAAKRFYRRQGGEEDTAWENWVLDVGACLP
jgi:ribosomal protein S18 acetylase RimI-like enzyme